MRNILITGGAGFLGSHLSRNLPRTSYSVAIYDNFTVGRLSNLGGAVKHVEILQGDVRDSSDLTVVLGKIRPHIVIHLAAIHYFPYCQAHPNEVHEVNIQGKENLLAKLMTLGSNPLFVLASSAAVYKEHKGAIAEDDPVAPISVYGKSKLASEMLVRQYHKVYKLDYVILRLFNAYGARDSTPHLIPSLISQLKHTDRIRVGNISAKRDFIFVSDVVRATNKLLGAGVRNRIYNVGSGKEYSVATVIEYLAKLTGRTLDVLQDPQLMRSVEIEHLRADIRRIRDELRWTPRISLKGGLRSLLKHEEINLDFAR